MQLLFVAADPMEFPGILKHAQNARPYEAGLDWVRLARLGGHEVFLAANGAGWKRAGAAVDAAIRDFRPDAVISTGFCGALDDSFGIADIVAADSVAGPDRCFRASLPASTTVYRTGTICSVDRVAATAEEKARLRAASGACAVEMEAAAVAERAMALNMPFFCIRAVTDLPGESMANDLNAALRPDGHFDTIIILREALRRPFIRFPELVRLRGRARRAAYALGDFIASCRF